MNLDNFEEEEATEDDFRSLSMTFIFVLSTTLLVTGFLILI